LLLLLLLGRMIGMALLFLGGLTTSERLRSILPKMELVRLPTLSLPDTGLVTESETLPKGVKAGASGRNFGPEAEKLNSLWPGEKTGAAALILEMDCAPNECADGEATDDAKDPPPAWKTDGWKLLLPLPKVKLALDSWPGLNLNSGALTLSFDSDGLLAWLGLLGMPELLDADETSFHGLLVVEKERWCCCKSVVRLKSCTGVPRLLGLVSISAASSIRLVLTSCHPAKLSPRARISSW